MTRPVLLLGVPSEPPIEFAAAACDRIGAPYVLWDQRRVAYSTCHVSVDASGVAGRLECDGWALDLGDRPAVYTRLASWATLPGLTDLDSDDPLVAHAAQVHSALDDWLEATPALVVNRTAANDSNNAKPYQALTIRPYFHVPDTLVTNDPAAVLAFRAEHDRIIYKSISGERSIVSEFQDGDLDRLHLLAHGPVQLQEWIDGIDLRVHVVGNQVFTTEVESAATDYRYDHSAAGAAFRAVDLPADVAAACVALAANLGLGLAGLDLRCSKDGRVVCFEVNPSPAYSVYEAATGQPISLALARFLAGAPS